MFEIFEECGSFLTNDFFLRIVPKTWNLYFIKNQRFMQVKFRHSFV